MAESRQGVLEQVDERLIDRSIAALRQIVIGGQVELLIRVGEYLLEHFYGSVEEARSHRPRKRASLDRLAARAEEFGMTSTGVRRSVPVALQARELGREVAHKLGPARHVVLLPVRDSDEKRALAEAAIKSGWTVEKLRAQVARVSPPHPGGRPPTPRVRLMIERVARVLDGDALAGRLADHLDAISPVEARSLLAQVNRARAVLERLEKALIRAAARPG